MEGRKTDYEIKQQVLRELKWDSRIAWAQIGVEVNDGLVTLSGAVRRYAKQTAAQQAAHPPGGARPVPNERAVKPTGSFGASDQEIPRPVRHTLEWGALVPDDRIQSTVSDGW